MAIITIHMRKNDGLEKKKKIFSHPGGSVSLPGVRELGCISGRLPDDPGGFTCMIFQRPSGRGELKMYIKSEFGIKNMLPMGLPLP